MVGMVDCKCNPGGWHIDSAPGELALSSSSTSSPGNVSRSEVGDRDGVEATEETSSSSVTNAGFQGSPNVGPYVRDY
jgi:hypothetical protein